ncbi:glycosyltransferase [Brevibacterium sp.]|uniref:glycosyltransferase n=1 Tax=Brevibacterium sp. TaxID=1701 RepID=UPI0025BFB535|nr:glycosyltransferase [Brevibacterium sp.]
MASEGLMKAFRQRLSRMVRREPAASPVVSFPPVRYVAMTWGIPEDFGGLTSVLLRRSSKLAELGALSIPLLTFDSSLDITAKAAELKSAGRLGDGVSLRNCWSEVAVMTDRQLSVFAGASAQTTSDSSGSAGLSVSSESSRRRTLVDDEGEVRCIEHLRADGSVYIRDERKSGGGLILLNRRGAPVAHWSKARDFYLRWIDSVVGDQPTVLVNDSKFAGSFLRYYRRSHVKTVQVFHNPHLSGDAVTPYGPFTKSRSDIILEHESFDGLAFLTDRQREDFLAAFARKSGTFVVPNSRHIADVLPDPREARPATSGVMLARLSEQKQVDHAVKAVAEFDDADPAARVKIDVYGSGPLEEDIAALIERVEMGDRIELKGYDPDASAKLAEASFLVLSSKYEGLPLVLVEAMAAGCIPIAYDVRYGPRDVITHGVDGLVVPEGDHRALADAIRSVVTMDEDRLASMRAAAQRKARSFDDLTVSQMWADVCAELAASRPAGAEVGSGAVVTRAHLDEVADEPVVSLCGQLLGDWTEDSAEMRLRASSRNRRFGFDVEVAQGIDGGERRFAVEIPLSRFTAASAIYDFWLTTVGRSRRVRLSLAEGAIDAAAAERPGGNLELYATVHGNLSARVG